MGAGHKLLLAKLLYVLSLCLALAASGPVAAESRLALVIGNAAYIDTPLENPVNDARAMSVVLRDAGFDVISAFDADLATMQRSVVELGQRTRPDSTVLVFYAGHGVQSKGRNYLLPVDAMVESESALRYNALDLSDVLDELEDAGGRINIVVLDACRNNPFEQKTRGRGRGLVAVDAAQGTLIAYATSPGSLAADGNGDNGLYTESLLNAIRKPNLKIEEVFKQVRIDVSAKSRGMQVPWESSSLTGDFVFFPGGAAAGTSAQTQSVVSSQPALAANGRPANRTQASRCDDLSGTWANRNEGPALCPPPTLEVTRTGSNIYDLSGTACGVKMQATGKFENQTLTVNWAMTPCTGVTVYHMDKNCESGSGPMEINKSLFCVSSDNTGSIQRTLQQ